MATRPPDRRRCAVYTRKSSEEGLDQAFNSLHAQRESCEAFILSQKSEGWVLIPDAYDDGGYSGGSMDRPGLKKLLADIGAGLVDIVVVYKVDRLTRALSDFARIVEQFDARGISFVAVTQQFNTTTSMGRLTLNVLLSFAQFEREVTGERIRDKIAASKAKGMWTGGLVPFGYEAINRKLEVNDRDAESVRQLFHRYIACGSVRDLVMELARQPDTDEGSARWKRTSRGALFHMLTNPVYIGRVRHGDKEYPGQHEAIVPAPLWESAQQLLRANGGKYVRRPRTATSDLLAGRICDGAGEPLISTYAMKGQRRYRYYTSRALVVDGRSAAQEGWRLPATAIEHAVVGSIVTALEDQANIALTAVRAGVAAPVIPLLMAEAKAVAARLTLNGSERGSLEELLTQVRVSESGLQLTLALGSLLKDREPQDGPDLTLLVHIPMKLKRRGVELRLVINPDATTTPANLDQPLIRIVARARVWMDELISGEAASIMAIARREDLTAAYVTRLLPLACLAPSLVEDILAGQQPLELTAEAATRRLEVPAMWADQAGALRALAPEEGRAHG